MMTNTILGLSQLTKTDMKMYLVTGVSLFIPQLYPSFISMILSLSAQGMAIVQRHNIT